MILKLIGSVVVIASSISVAISHRIFQEKKLKTLDGFIALLMYIKGQVDCYALPLYEMLMGIPPEILCDCNSPMGVESLDELIGESRVYLEDESLRLLESFSLEFGSIFREEQLRRCDFYIEALVEERKRLSADVERRARVGGALSVCAMIGLVILLW